MEVFGEQYGMLGWIKGDYDVGMYSVSVKVYSIVKTTIASLYAVSVPRLSYYHGNHDYDNYKRLSTTLFSTVALLLIPSSVGMICLAKEIMYFMGGQQFLEASGPLMILAVSLIFAILGGMVTYCLNVSLGFEKINFNATLIGATINLLLNLWFIPRYSYNGAAITTCISELFVFLFSFFKLKEKKKIVDFCTIVKNIKHSLLGSCIIVLVCSICKIILHDKMLILSFAIVISVVAYLGILIILRNNIAIEALKKIKRKIEHGRN